MSEVKTGLPAGAVFTLTVPLDRDKTKSATFHMKDIDEATYLAAKSLIDKGKDFDATRLMVKTLTIGGDSPDIIKDNFIAINSAAKALIELIKPVEGELKKN